MSEKKLKRDVSGWLVLDKPYGMTSTQAVGKVRWLFGAKKAGHAGTLDPLATGILPIALGEATKTVPVLQDGRKVYRFSILWGAATTTDDAEGAVVETSAHRPSEADVLAALPAFTGTILQAPPAFSAIKVDGERAYDLARSGEQVELAARPIVIEALRLTDLPDINHGTFEVTCGKGTYIRSLARDLGAALGCGAHLAALRRTAVGEFALEQAIRLDALTEGEGAAERVREALLPPESAVADWPSVQLDAEAMQRIRNGLPIAAEREGERARAHTPDGALLALLRRNGDRWQPSKVFDWS